MKTTINKARTDILKYGTNEIGVPYFRNRLWSRVDTYTSRDSGEVSRERRFAAGSKDLSPMFQDGVNGYYNGEHCSCCYLNFSHTVDEHNKNIADGQRSK